MSPEEQQQILAKLKPGEWVLVKGCDCNGASKPNRGFFPMPVCCLCGKPWRILGKLGTLHEPAEPDKL